MKYSIIEVIEIMIDCPKAKFQRVNDNNFIISRGWKGDILIHIKGDYKGILPLFNYLHDKWIRIEDE